MFSVFLFLSLFLYSLIILFFFYFSQIFKTILQLSYMKLLLTVLLFVFVISTKVTSVCIKIVKTGPSFADAAMGRIAQGTKVLAEGGYEKIFRQTFETVPEEQLQDSYACYLSTSAGPVMGVLYVSTAKLAFCSDNPLSYTVNGQTEWSYYKVHLYDYF